MKCTNVIMNLYTNLKVSPKSAKFSPYSYLLAFFVDNKNNQWDWLKESANVYIDNKIHWDSFRIDIN